MKKIFNYLTVTAFIIFSLLEIVILFSFNKGYYYKENRDLKLYQDVSMTEEGVNQVFSEMFDYLKDDMDDLNGHTYEIKGMDSYFYNEREIAHMKDVKVLFSYVLLIRNVCGIISLLSLICYKFYDFKLMLVAFKSVLFLLVCFVAAAGIYAMVDFTSFWITFHELLFTNDLWLLDPRTCLLIRIMPETLFNDLVMPLITTLLLFFTGLWLLLSYLKGKVN